MSALPLPAPWRVSAAAFRLQLRGISWLSVLVGAAVQPATYVTLTLAANRTGRLDADALVLGSGVLAAWTATLWHSGMVLRKEFWSGTLPAVCSRPGGLGPVLVGKTIAATTLSVGVIMLSVSSAAALSGHRVHIADPAAFTAALVMGLAATIPLGLLVACLFLLTRAAIRVAEVLVYPVFVIGGLLIPLTELPSWIRPFAGGLSLHWLSVLLTDAAAGQPSATAAWLALPATGLLYAAAARLAFRRVLHRAREEGNLEIF
ncbi:hypothetical protein [Streptomyces sp. BPTC-684]|uniref:ABC transporter permease n=1 Tax=Streptomyces sp. BPTC-684 TaxID=3043734 RepID=UPI0024B138A5|nr:hypothetical protein [Streptomyces sp. BPTC-684]WHM37882.1 hypothetical protein QIY60_13840 [Streptomyces sp. BPTC-684]